MSKVPISKEKATNEKPSSPGSSIVELKVHSSCYKDFFLLRTPITINGRPAVIEEVNGEPVLGVSGISVKLSAILQQAVAPVATKHGVYQVDNFYYEQVALFSINFQSKSSLKQFLTDKEAVQKELSSAISNLFKESAKLSKQLDLQSSRSPDPSMEQIHDVLAVADTAKVYLVSPAIGHSPAVQQINHANHSFMFETWKRSKLFDFSSTIFTEPPSVNISGGPGDDYAELAELLVELKEVNAWFELGVQLKIPTHDLLAIREDHRNMEKCRLEMLIRWEQLEKPTWTNLTSALANIGMKALVDRLAEKYGLPQPFRVIVTSASSKLMESEQKLSVKTKELKQAKQLQTLTSQKLKKEVSEEVPLLQHKVKSLTTETEFLQMQLKRRNEEMEMFKKMKLAAKQDELELLNSLLKEKNEQIRSLQNELSLKKMKLVATKKQLREKEIKLAEMLTELSVKSDQVFELETEVESLRQSFDEQQEEMNKKLIETSALSVSHEMYLREVEIQLDIAMKEASKKKEEIQSYSQKLTSKEEQIRRLAEKIAEQETKMAKLQEELDSHHPTSEQLSAEQMRQDDERDQQLLTLRTLTIQLKLEQKTIENEKKNENVNLERMKWYLAKHESNIAQTNQSRTPKPSIHSPVKQKPERETNISPVTQGNLRANTEGQWLSVERKSPAAKTSKPQDPPVKNKPVSKTNLSSAESSSRMDGSLPNAVGTTSPEAMGETGSSTVMKTAKTISFLPIASIDSTVTVKNENDDPILSSTSNSVTVEGECLGHDSFTPPRLLVGSMMTASMKSVETQKVFTNEGPYPMIIEPPGGRYWIENGQCVSALGEDGIWRAPKISTEHYTIQTDTIANIYGRCFVGQEHTNYIANDSTAGPALLSLKFEEDYQGVQARALLRTKNETIYIIIPSSLLPGLMKPEDYFKYISKQHGEEMNIAKAVEITSAKDIQLIQMFDEHTANKTHKFGIIYQKRGQTSEEELFSNNHHPDALEEFLNMLGEKVKLKGFKGYDGGLDVTNDQTGEYSFHTEYKDRAIMFHVSTLFPHDPNDTDHVQKKRHIGNDIVVIVFQDENAQFCPSMLSSHSIHSYIVLQVEHPNTDHTVYRVSTAAKQEVANFEPPIPNPAVFQKGTEFRDWLLMKALNAEFNSHNTSTFLKVANQTREQLFKHLVVELSSTVEEVDHSPPAKHLMMSLKSGVGSTSRDPNFHQERKRTRFSIFSKRVRPSSSSFPKKGSSSYLKTPAQSVSKHTVWFDLFSSSDSNSPQAKKKPNTDNVKAKDELQAQPAISLLQQQQSGGETVQSPLLEPKLPLKFKWRQGSDMPFEMTSGPSAVLMKGDIYFGGGYASSDKDEQTVCVYSPSSDSWSQLTLYEYRYFSLTVINENQLVAIGGIAVSTRKKTNKLAVWDDKQRQWVFSLPVMKTACNSPAATTYNQWMLVAGGYGEQGRLSRVEVMNVSYEQWYRVASLPVAGSHMASTIIGNMWYISGGNTNDGASKSVMSVCVEHIILDAISQSGGANPSTLSRWNSLSDTPLITPTVLAFHGALLAVGCGGIFSLTSAIYLYQPSKSKWIKAGDMPTERDKPACTVLPNGHIMIAGGFGANNRVDIAQVM